MEMLRPSHQGTKRTKSFLTKAELCVLCVFAVKICLLLMCLGCQSQTKEPQGTILARVGDVVLTLKELEAGIPDDVQYRKKTRIALDQIRRSLSNGIRVAAWTFDEWYGRDREFLDGLDALGQSYVGEVPVTFTGWSHQPQILQTQKYLPR